MNSNNIHKSLTTVLHNERVNDHYQQQEHRSRCFGRSNSLLLLSLLLTLVAAGSGFLFVSLLPTGRIINNSSNNYNYNNGENLSITTTTEEFVLFAKNFYRELLRNYTTATTKVVDGSVVYDYDGAYDAGYYKKDDSNKVKPLVRDLQSLEKGLKSNKSGKSEGKGQRDEISKSQKSRKSKGKTQRDETSRSQKSRKSEGKGKGKGDDKSNIQKSKKSKKLNTKKSKSKTKRTKKVKKTKNPTTKRSTNAPTPFDTLDLASVDGLAGPSTRSLPKRNLIIDLTSITKEILDIDDDLSASPYKDCIVKVIIPKTSNCNNVYPDDENVPEDVTTCYVFTISVINNGGSCNADDATELVTEAIISGGYIEALSYTVIIKPSPVPTSSPSDSQTIFPTKADPISDPKVPIFPVLQISAHDG